MPKNKKKRKSSAAHVATPPPARPAAMDGRRPISYGDLETMPAPPVPRHMVSYASSEDEDEDTAKIKAAKKAEEEAAEEEAAEYRHRIMSRESDGTYDANRAQPRTDPTYGQVGAFPGLDTYQFAPFYGPANDGLDYLRMVRSEARGIPHIVTSASRKRIQQESDDGHEAEDVDEDDGYAREMEEADEAAWAEEMANADGYYSDGAYVAKPLPLSTGHMKGASIDPQEAYYERLKVLFAQHRVRCQASPPAQAVAALDENHPISYPMSSSVATGEWRRLLITTSPLPAQLYSMDKWTIWRLLRLVERHIRRLAMRLENIPSTLSQWIWGLLGRCQEQWQMVNEDISKIRELGKCATWCLSQYRYNKARRYERRCQDADQGDEVRDWEYDDEDDGGNDSTGKQIDAVEEDGAAETESSSKGAQDPQEVKKGVAEVEAISKKTNDLHDADVLEKTSTSHESRGEEKAEVSSAATIRTGTVAEGDSLETVNDPDTEMVDQTQGFAAMLAAKRAELQETDDRPEPEAELDGGEEGELNVQVPDEQTTAILDLIITVTGEFYGQRDILWSRPGWQDEEGYQV